MTSHDAVETAATDTGTDDPLQVLMVSPRYAPYIGGTEIHTGTVSAELVRRGHHVTVLTTDLVNSLPDHEVLDGVDVRRVRAWPRGSDLYLAPKLTSVIAEGGWDLVHVQGYHTAVAPLALAKAQRLGLATVLTFHSGGHSSPLRNLLRPTHSKLLSRWLLNTDLLIGVSDFEADLFARRLGVGRDRIRVIPNGISEVSTRAPDDGGPGEQAPARNLRAVDAGPTILSLGRLVRYKGHHRVIKAMPHLLELDPTVHLTIVGQGPYRRRLDKLVDRLDLGDHVSFDYVEGYERHRLGELMADASLAILLSTYESHGMAAHEALTAGLPVIVHDRSALSELASAGLARAVPHRATDREVAEIMARTLSADERETAVSPEALARFQRPWSDITDQLEAGYRQVLGRRARAAYGPSR